MLISNQGIRPGSINMGRILRSLRHHSDMSRKVVYHRPPIFTKDDYGVETNTVDTNELLLPELPALIRPALTADYNLERAGVNIIGAARVYTPNIQTIKGFSNFNQDNNVNFNEIEGWDRFIDKTRNIYQVPTSANGNTSGGAADAGTLTLSGANISGTATTLGVWSDGTAAGSTYDTDGDALAITLGGTPSGTVIWTPNSTTNVLEADRISFKIKASGTVKLRTFSSFNGGTSANDELKYDNGDITIPTDSWMTVDVPFVTGTVASGTSIFLDGTRYAVAVSSGSSFTYVENLNKFEFDISGSDNDIAYIRDFNFYKSISWHVHSLKELNAQYTIYNCVRVAGKRDSRRRAYET